MHKWLLLGFLLGAPELSAKGQDSELNVNSRYTVESVHVNSKRGSRLSNTLRTDLDRIIGEKLDHQILQKLAARIQRELKSPIVSIRVTRGMKPDHVAVDFEVEKPPDNRVNVNLPKFLYHSRQGWSGVGEAQVKVSDNVFTFGMLSDGDEKLERFAGVQARYEKKSIGTDRLGLRFEFDSYHQQWNNATLRALQGSSQVPGIYRTRQNFAPSAIVTLARPLEAEFGVSIQNFETQFPTARTESANAVVTTLRYHPRWEDSDGDKHEVDASYGFRAATKALDSDFVYARHTVDAHYRFKRGHSTVDLGFLGGRMEGRAPLFERFVLGNATTLRGWNKYDLDPLGGSRAAHGSIDYQWHVFKIFYDTGAIWDRGGDAEQKHAVGVGFRFDSFQLAVAFPIREGRATPVFYAGMNF
jgi:hypothetical protein